MAVSVANLFKERKYPFIFSLVVLVICVSVLLLNNNRYPYLSVIDFKKSESISSSPPKDSNSSIWYPKSEEPHNSEPPQDISSNLNFRWKFCQGPAAVDYIPCLDNMKAIKGLKSRRHMEHRERHCPEPSPRCLIPLPKGYRIPIPWPKSRDMVRLILW